MLYQPRWPYRLRSEGGPPALNLSDALSGRTNLGGIRWMLRSGSRAGRCDELSTTSRRNKEQH